MLAKALASDEVKPEDLDPKIVATGSTPVNDNDNDVDLDMEVGEMLKNNGQYKMMVNMLAKLYQEIGAAMQTGDGT